MKSVFLIFCWHVGYGGSACNQPQPQPSQEICEFMGHNMMVAAAKASQDDSSNNSYRCVSYTTPVKTGK